MRIKLGLVSEHLSHTTKLSIDFNFVDKIEYITDFKFLIKIFYLSALLLYIIRNDIIIISDR